MQTIEFNVPSSAVNYILFQRSRYLKSPNSWLYRVLRKVLPFPIFNPTVALEAKLRPGPIKPLYAADMKSEFETIREALPERCRAFLDIGCGVAGIDAFLHRHYAAQNPTVHLLVRIEAERNVLNKMNPRAAFRHSLESPKFLLLQKGVPPHRINLLEATGQYDMEIDGSADLVLSPISWGFHYPVENYLDRVYQLFIPRGALILDVRSGSGGVAALRGRLNTNDVILEGNKFHQRLATKWSPDRLREGCSSIDPAQRSKRS